MQKQNPLLRQADIIAGGSGIGGREFVRELADEIRRYEAQVADMDEQLDEFVRRELIIGNEAARQALENRRLRDIIHKAHLACTKSSLTAAERVFDATSVLSDALIERAERAVG